MIGTNLYPPKTIVAFGHLDSALVNILVASAIAPADVPFALTLSKIAAVYAFPTPWQLTLALPYVFFRPLQMIGPMEPP
jgi:hypothetical protein